MNGNERFQQLVQLVDDKRYRFPFDIYDKEGVHGVREIRNRILAERSSGSTETIDFFEKCFMDPEVQEIFNLKPPIIHDYSDVLQVKEGKVYGLELRLMGPTGSHKDLLMASLFMMQVMANGIGDKTRGTDAGIYNSARALAGYTNLFGFDGSYFIPADIPDNLIANLEAIDGFEVTRVPLPKSGNIDKKNNTYRALLRRFMADSKFQENTFHLGHAELGFFSTYGYGRSFVRLMQRKNIQPDMLFTPMGAAITAIGIGEPLQDSFGTEICIGEYQEHTPVKRKIPSKFKGILRPSAGFIPRYTLYEARSVDEALEMHLNAQGYDMGLTSAGSLAAARIFANRGKTVVVPIFERYRDYSLDARNIISRSLQLNPFIPEDFWDRVSAVYHTERQETSSLKMHPRKSAAITLAIATYAVIAAITGIHMMVNDTPFVSGFEIDSPSAYKTNPIYLRFNKR